MDQNRIDNLNIKICLFTNLSHDHLDYHKNIKSYLNAKMYLFNKLLKKKSIVFKILNHIYSGVKRNGRFLTSHKFTEGDPNESKNIFNS